MLDVYMFSIAVSRKTDVCEPVQHGNLYEGWFEWMCAYHMHVVGL